MLGAPSSSAQPRFSPLLAFGVVALAVALPLFGLSLLLAMAIDFLALPSLPRIKIGLDALADHQPIFITRNELNRGRSG